MKKLVRRKGYCAYQIFTRLIHNAAALVALGPNPTFRALALWAHENNATLRDDKVIQVVTNKQAHVLPRTLPGQSLTFVFDYVTSRFPNLRLGSEEELISPELQEQGYDEALHDPVVAGLNLPAPEELNPLPQQRLRHHTIGGSGNCWKLLPFMPGSPGIPLTPWARSQLLTSIRDAPVEAVTVEEVYYRLCDYLENDPQWDFAVGIQWQNDGDLHITHCDVILSAETATPNSCTLIGLKMFLEDYLEWTPKERVAWSPGLDPYDPDTRYVGNGGSLTNNPIDTQLANARTAQTIAALEARTIDPTLQHIPLIREICPWAVPKELQGYLRDMGVPVGDVVVETHPSPVHAATGRWLHHHILPSMITTDVTVYHAERTHYQLLSRALTNKAIECEASNNITHLSHLAEYDYDTLSSDGLELAPTTKSLAVVSSQSALWSAPDVHRFFTRSPDLLSAYFVLTAPTELLSFEYSTQPLLYNFNIVRNPRDKKNIVLYYAENAAGQHQELPASCVWWFLTNRIAGPEFDLFMQKAWSHGPFHIFHVSRLCRATNQFGWYPRAQWIQLPKVLRNQHAVDQFIPVELFRSVVLYGQSLNNRTKRDLWAKVRMSKDILQSSAIPLSVLHSFVEAVDIWLRIDMQQHDQHRFPDSVLGLVKYHTYGAMKRLTVGKLQLRWYKKYVSVINDSRAHHRFPLQVVRVHSHHRGVVFGDPGCYEQLYHDPWWRRLFDSMLTTKGPDDGTFLPVPPRVTPSWKQELNGRIPHPSLQAPAAMTLTRLYRDEGVEPRPVVPTALTTAPTFISSDPLPNDHLEKPKLKSESTSKPKTPVAQKPLPALPQQPAPKRKKEVIIIDDKYMTSKGSLVPDLKRYCKVPTCTQHHPDAPFQCKCGLQIRVAPGACHLCGNVCKRPPSAHGCTNLLCEEHQGPERWVSLCRSGFVHTGRNGERCHACPGPPTPTSSDGPPTPPSSKENKPNQPDLTWHQRPPNSLPPKPKVIAPGSDVFLTYKMESPNVPSLFKMDKPVAPTPNPSPSWHPPGTNSPAETNVPASEPPDTNGTEELSAAARLRLYREFGQPPGAAYLVRRDRRAWDNPCWFEECAQHETVRHQTCDCPWGSGGDYCHVCRQPALLTKLEQHCVDYGNCPRHEIHRLDTLCDSGVPCYHHCCNPACGRSPSLNLSPLALSLTMSHPHSVGPSTPTPPTLWTAVPVVGQPPTSRAQSIRSLSEAMHDTLAGETNPFRVRLASRVHTPERAWTYPALLKTALPLATHPHPPSSEPHSRVNTPLVLFPDDSFVAEGERATASLEQYPETPPSPTNCVPLPAGWTYWASDITLGQLRRQELPPRLHLEHAVNLRLNGRTLTLGPGWVLTRQLFHRSAPDAPRPIDIGDHQHPDWICLRANCPAHPTCFMTPPEQHCGPHPYQGEHCCCAPNAPQPHCSLLECVQHRLGGDETCDEGHPYSSWGEACHVCYQFPAPVAIPYASAASDTDSLVKGGAALPNAPLATAFFIRGELHVQHIASQRVISTSLPTTVFLDQLFPLTAEKRHNREYLGKPTPIKRIQPPTSEDCLLKCFSALTGQGIPELWALLHWITPPLQADSLLKPNQMLSTHQLEGLALYFNFNVHLDTTRRDIRGQPRLYGTTQGPPIWITFRDEHYSIPDKLNKRYSTWSTPLKRGQRSPAASSLRSKLMHVTGLTPKPWKPDWPRAEAYIREMRFGNTGTRLQQRGEDTLRAWEEYCEKSLKDDRHVEILTIYGNPGSGKTHPIQQLLAKEQHKRKWNQNSTYCVITPTTILRHDWAKRLDLRAKRPDGKGTPAQYCMTFEEALESTAEICILDELGKYPPGYVSALVGLNPNLCLIVLLGDAEQSSWHEPKAECSLNAVQSEVDYFSPYCQEYWVGTYRLPARIASFFNMPTASKDTTSGFRHRSKLQDNIPTIVASRAGAMEVALLHGNDSTTMPSSQGLSFPVCQVVIDRNAIELADDRVLWTALSRAQGPCYIIWMFTHDQRVLANLHSRPLLARLYAYRNHPDDCHMRGGVDIPQLLSTWNRHLMSKRVLRLDAAQVTNDGRFNDHLCPVFHQGKLVPWNTRVTGGTLQEDYFDAGSEDSKAFYSQVRRVSYREPVLEPATPVQILARVHFARVSREFLVENHRGQLPERFDQELRSSKARPGGDYSTQKEDLPKLRRDTRFWNKEVKRLIKQGYHPDAAHAKIEPLRYVDMTALAPFHQMSRKDRVAFAVALKKRITFATPEQNEQAYRVALEDYGPALWNSIVDLIPRLNQPIPWDQEFYETCCLEFEYNRLQTKSRQELNAARARAAPEWADTYWQLDSKSEFKAKMEKMFKDSIALQTLVTTSDKVLFMLGGLARYITHFLLRNVPPNLILYIGYSPSQLNDIVAAKWLDVLSQANDFSQFDSLQDAGPLAAEISLMGQLSAPSSLIAYYYWTKTHSTTQYGSLGVMRLTGEVFTFLFNTLFNLAITNMRFDLSSFVRSGRLAAFGGDDSCINGVLTERAIWIKYSKRFEKSFKLELTDRPTFCSWRLTAAGIFKDPTLLFARMRAKDAQGLRQEVFTSYMYEWSFAFRLGDELVQYCDELELEYHTALSSVFLRSKFPVYEMLDEWDRPASNLQTDVKTALAELTAELNLTPKYLWAQKIVAQLARVPELLMVATDEPEEEVEY